MKKLIYLTAAILICATRIAIAQAPQAMNYQTIVRDNSGNIVANQSVKLGFIIHDVSATGAVVYSETQTATTNQFGLFNAAIGRGTVVSGTFSSITWSGGSKYLEVNYYTNPSSSTFVSMGSTELLSVPYALYAGNASNGATGATGAAGTMGPAGATGPAGAPGTNGNNGVTGPTGAAGANGSDGATGATGANGVVGATGANGAAGAAGATGPAGANGTNGATGPTGATGPAAADGLDGVTGPTGAAGADGATGPTGAAGTNGTNGLNGATGAAGTNGATGATGAAGADGTNGATGPTGAVGATGPAGSGSAPTVTSITFTGVAVTAASVDGSGYAVYTGVGTTLFSYTATTTGTYQLTGYVTVNTTAAAGGGEVGSLTLKNNTTTVGIYSVYANLYPMSGQVSAILSLTAGDVLTLNGEYTANKYFNGDFKLLKY